jgi:ABC-type thiamine transport system ATPase subunit
MIAGFEESTSGDIFFGERRMNEVPPNRRDTAMVFQSSSTAQIRPKRGCFKLEMWFR